MVTKYTAQPDARPPQSAKPSIEPQLQISVLGPLRVSYGNRPVRLLGMKQRALLCWLSLNTRTAVSTDTLINALWGDDSPSTARAKVHTYVSELRKSLHGIGEQDGPGWPVLTSQSGYQLYNDVELDSIQFEEHCGHARQAARLGEHGQAFELFSRAVKMWRGPALMDIISDAIQAVANALNEERMLAIEGKAEAGINLGWNDEVIAELSPLSAANPLRERLRGQLILALYRRGARNEALEVYREGHHVTNSALGLPPTRQLRRLQQLILHDNPALWTQSPNDLLSVEATEPGCVGASAYREMLFNHRPSRLCPLTISSVGCDESIPVTAGLQGEEASILNIQSHK